MSVTKEKPKTVTKPLWIITHTHDHGMSMWPVFSKKKPDKDAIIASDPKTFEIDNVKEFLDIDGPFRLSKIEHWDEK